MIQASDQTHVVVIGAGPGGYPAAFLAADMGMKVTMIDESKNPGGVCLYRGCIPSKALLHAARIIHESREAAAFGIKFNKPKIDVDKLRDWKNKVVGKLTGGLGALAKQRKVNFIQGRARFEDDNTVRVTKADGSEQTLSFDHAIVATGSSPAKPGPLGLDSDRVLDSTSGLEVESIPENLLVIGGGYIGLEMGTVYASLGSKVTAVEMTSGLLPGADRDLVEVLDKQVRERFDQVLLDTKVVEMSEAKGGGKGGGGGVNVKLSGLGLDQPERTFEKVLVSVGRRPNTREMGLENTGVEVDGRGFVNVDDQRRTAAPTIFAIGDAAGEPMLAHKATHEARVAVRAIAGEPSAYEPKAIPAVVFTDPEVAWAGLTETQALNEGVPFKKATFPWAASGRATTLWRNEGLTKLLLDPHTERVLGAGMVGVGVGDLIIEAVMAIEMGATADDLQQIIHPHPTLSETVMEAAEVFFGHSPHYMPRERASKRERQAKTGAGA